MSSSKKFEVLLSETAVNQLRGIDKKIQKTIKRHLKELATDPFRKRAKADIKKLKGFKEPELFRLRVGKFRIIYSIEKSKVKVTEIIRREKGYKWL